MRADPSESGRGWVVHFGVLTVVLALLATPPAAQAQQAAKTYRISYLALTPGEDTTLVEAERAAGRATDGV
jgi:hypothetical protein